MTLRKLDTHFFANILSHFAGPPVEIPVLLISFFLPYLSWPLDRDLVFFLVSFLSIGWLAPVLYFIYALNKGLIGDIDATDRRDRFVPYTVAFLSWTVLLVLAWVYFSPEFVRAYMFFYLVGLVIWLVTFFYKISVHAAINMMLYWRLNILLGWKVWWLFPLVLLVCWFRWVNKRHTFWQLVLGVLLVIALGLGLN